MSLFCFLVVSLFIAFRHTLAYGRFGRRGLTIAFALGFVAALLRQTVGDIIPAGLFGFLRWLHIFVDRSALPALLPLGAWYLLKRFRGAAFDAEAADFALVWLAPFAALRAVAWSAEGNPADLLLAPILWISISVSVPPLVAAIEREYGFRAFAAAAAAALVPILGTTADWAFFAHLPFVGLLAFAAGVTPAVWATIQAFRSAPGAFSAEKNAEGDDASDMSWRSRLQ